MGFKDPDHPAANAFGRISNPTDVKYIASIFQLVSLDASRKAKTEAENIPIEQFKKTIPLSASCEIESEFWLDRDPPMAIPALTWVISPGDPHFVIFANDSPSFSLAWPSLIPNSISAYSEFRTIVAVKPKEMPIDDGIWCPIKVIKWSWRSQAEFNSEIQNWEDPVFELGQLNDFSIDTLPQWSDRAHEGIDNAPQHPDWRKK